MQYLQKRKEAIKLLGNKCRRCGFKDKRALQIDHVRGNGAEERREFGARTNDMIFDRIMAGDSADYQLLCANCNWIKRYDNHEAKVPEANFTRMRHFAKRAGVII